MRRAESSPLLLPLLNPSARTHTTVLGYGEPEEGEGHHTGGSARRAGLLHGTHASRNCSLPRFFVLRSFSFLRKLIATASHRARALSSHSVAEWSPWRKGTTSARGSGPSPTPRPPYTPSAARYRTAFPCLLPVAGPLGAKIVPCATQNAHADIVTAVEWRTSTKHGEKKYQLVSWSKDQHLKFWKIDQPIFVRAPPNLCAPIL
jgi:hypothetical protein